MSEYIITREQIAAIVMKYSGTVMRFTDGTLFADYSKIDRDEPITLNEITRCRDCVGFYETWDGYECQRFSGECHRAEPDGFCAWAERKEE